jgi:phosphatidylglycerophosphate synthase
MVYSRYTSLGLTLVRIPVGFALLVAIVQSRISLAGVLLATFVLADIADGVVARRTSSDSDFRRALDGMVDRCVSCSALLLGAATLAPTVLPVALVVWGREIGVAIPNVRLVARGVVFKASALHKANSLAMCGFGYAILAGGLVVWLAAIVMGAVSLGLLPSYIKQQKTWLGVSERSTSYPGRFPLVAEISRA